MKTTPQSRDLALAAGDDLGGFARRRLAARLEREPALAEELESFRAVRTAFAPLADVDMSEQIGGEARARLRMRVRARLREEVAATAQAPARSWLRAVPAGSLAAGVLAVALALLMKNPVPAEQYVERVQAVAPVSAEHEVAVFMTRSAEGPVLNWREGDAGSRYRVLSASKGGESRMLTELCGQSWVVPGQAGAGLQVYKVVLLSERCS